MIAMTNTEMADHTTRILRTATADETMATDAMTATAQFWWSQPQSAKASPSRGS